MVRAFVVNNGSKRAQVALFPIISRFIWEDEDVMGREPEAILWEFNE